MCISLLLFALLKTDPRKSSPNLMYCSPEEGGGWKYKSSCYHVVTEMKPWKDAEKHCKNIYNGHLLTIRDKLEDYFLEYAIPDIREEMWIGIKTEVSYSLIQFSTQFWALSKSFKNVYEIIHFLSCIFCV